MRLSEMTEEQMIEAIQLIRSGKMPNDLKILFLPKAAEKELIKELKK